jgi:RimJ/RimL family protein N-acetyltransferase
MLNDAFPRRTPRLVLRRFSRDDLDDFHAYRSDAELARYQGWSPMSRDHAALFLAEMCDADFGVAGEWFQVAIALADSGRVIGDLGIQLRKTEPAVAEFGFTLAGLHQGRGYALEAARATLEVVFDRTEAVRVEAVTDARNAPSVRVLRKLGMRRAQVRLTEHKNEPCTEEVYVLERPA